MKGAGTDANVKLVLYGREGKSDDIVLKSDKKAFEAGSCDEFKENIPYVGLPVKLRVQHDSKGSFASWHLDRVGPSFLPLNSSIDLTFRSKWKI